MSHLNKVSHGFNLLNTHNPKILKKPLKRAKNFLESLESESPGFPTKKPLKSMFFTQTSFLLYINAFLRYQNKTNAQQ